MWYCHDRTAPTFAWLQSTDGSDAHTQCYRVDDIASLAKLAYYAAKLLKTFTPPP